MGRSGGYTAIDGTSVELLPCWLYGHSWMAADSQNTVGARWWQKLQRRLGLGTITNHAVNANGVLQMVTSMKNGAGLWASGRTGLAFLHAGVIEQVNWSDTEMARLTLRDNVHTWVRIIGSQTIGQSSAWTATGSGWLTQTTVNFSGGSYRYTQQVGDYIEFSITATEFGILDVPLDPAVIRGMVFTVHIDGNLIGTYTQDGPSAGGGSSHRTLWFSGLTNAAHTVRVTASALPSGAASAFLSLDGYIQPLATQVVPTACVLIDPYLPAYGTLENYNLWRQAIIDGVPSVAYATIIDLNAGWNPATMLGSDGLHPNDLGSTHVADVVAGALGSLNFRNGLNKLSTV